MKKAVTILLALCLLYSAAPAETGTVSVVDWSWFEDTVTSQVEGSFHTFDDLHCKIWIPDAYEDLNDPTELDDITVFLRMNTQTEDGKRADIDFGTMDAAAYPYDYLIQMMKDTGYITDISPMIINGYTAVRYKSAPDPWIKSGAVFWLDDSTVLVIETGSYEETYDGSFDALFNYVSFSVQPAE